MNKDEILEKSRKEGRDEGKEYTDSMGRRYGTAALCVMFAVLALFNLYHGQSNYQILALFFAYLGLEALGMYRASGQKFYLFPTTVGILASCLFCASYFMNV